MKSFSRFSALIGGIKSLVSTIPKRVESRVARMVGIMILLGAALCIATRTPMMDVGISCKEVAFRTNSIEEEYSAFSDLSRSLAAFMP